MAQIIFRRSFATARKNHLLLFFDRGTQNFTVSFDAVEFDLSKKQITYRKHLKHKFRYRNQMESFWGQELVEANKYIVILSRLEI